MAVAHALLRSLRDSSDRTLLAWDKGTESGMDNSPRWDFSQGRGERAHATRGMRGAVDFGVFLAADAAALARIARVLGNGTLASTWDAVAAAAGGAVHRFLWDDGAAGYYDALPDGALATNVSAVSNFLPLLLDDLPASRVAPMVARLGELNKGAPCPIPSYGPVGDPSFSTDMWRGPMWVNTNYLVAQGLRKHGERGLARALVNATLACVDGAYAKYGVLFEFYDSAGVHDPRTLLRKGARSGGVRDYHWTAALVFRMIQELDAGGYN